MTTPTIPADAKPLAVWSTDGDGGEDDLFWHHREEATAWAAEHIYEPNRTYLVEFYLAGHGETEIPVAVLHRYLTDERGNIAYEPGTYAPKRAEPVVQVLDSLPPRHLLTPAGGRAKVDP